MLAKSPHSVHLGLNRNQENKKTNQNTYQGMLKPYSNHGISADCDEEHVYEEVGKKKSPPEYTELDQTKREKDDKALYRHLVKK